MSEAYGSGARWNHRHRDVSGGKLRPIVSGAVDGLVTNGSLIAGVGDGGPERTALVLTDLAGLVAGAVSMASGEFISVANQNELVAVEAAVEQDRHERFPGAGTGRAPRGLRQLRSRPRLGRERGGRDQPGP